MIGGGSYGTAVARIMAEAVHAHPAEFADQVKMWVRRQEVADEINTCHTNKQYTGDTIIPSNVVATTSIAEAVAGSGVVVLGVPHQFLGALLSSIRDSLLPGAQIVSLIKSFGCDKSTGEIGPLSQSLSVQLGSAEVSVLMGPNIYTEMVHNLYAEATIGCRLENRTGQALMTELFCTPNFGVAVSPDVVGVELCGTLKNCITLGCGFCVGLRLGMNTKSAVIRLGHKEIVRFCCQFFEGVHEATFSEACGIGDLVLSCTVGRGQRLAAAFVSQTASPRKSWAELEVETLNGQKIPDWHTINEVHQFLTSHNALPAYPLMDAIYQVAYQSSNGADAIVSALRTSLAHHQSSGGL